MFSALIKVVRWTGNKKTRILFGFAYSFLISLVSAAPIAIAAWAMCGFLGLSNGEKPDLKIALTAGLAIIASIALRAALMWLRARAEETVAAERSNEVRLRIGEALKRVPLGYFDNHPSGEILSALTTELSFVEIHGMRMVDILGNGYITAAAMVAFLAFMDLRACILALAAITVATVVLELMFKNSARLSPAQNDAREDMAQATLEYIHGMPVVKSYRQVDAAVSAVRSAYARSRNVNLKTELAFQPFNALLLFVTRSASVGVIVIVCISFLNGTISLLNFCTLVMFSFMLFQSIEACGDAAYVIGHIGEVIDRLDAIESAPAIDDNCKAVKLEHHNLEMHDVSFAYGDGPLVLNGMSLTIPEGTTAALVGGSGSGKTTVAKLFARFYDATSGSVRIGGHDVRELSCNSILEDFSMVFQDVYLMDDTIERNIALSRPDAQFEEIVEAAKAARCDEFIKALPEGYKTKVGEGGARLSGGERQRISIARAILKDAPLVVLDEATASVDPENEAEIQAALAQLCKGKTVFEIAHRLSTIEEADQIFFLRDGRVAEQGTHEELISHNGPYHDFVEARSRIEGWQISK